MIYTVTFNPSLDYIIKVDDFKTGEINRTSDEKIFAGGKGINVSIVLKNLGHDSVPLGFVAGFTGRELVKRIEDLGISSHFIDVGNGYSRINVKMRSNEETEINGQGPKILDGHIEELYAILDGLEDDDILVISGSVPNTLPGDMYERILKRLEGKKLRVVVDAERDLLVKSLPYHPFLIKPNNKELGQIFDVTLKTRDEVVPYARKLQDMGARNVLISMAGEGAVLISEDGEVYKSEAPKGKLVNSIGAGDSMVAGFLSGYLKTGDYHEAFIKGLCTGSASAFSMELATEEEVNKLMHSLTQGE
ncbi:MAG: 1-phosphofructokinase [Erysipelotrichaceae bacterium]|nr:1-phosphofructokinase [Erysipelotrichaceae bacterium]